MANQISDVSIVGMKQSDFIQLKEMFDHMMEDGTYWGRKDYWDDRNERLSQWLVDSIESINGSKIEGFNNGK